MKASHIGDIKYCQACLGDLIPPLQCVRHAVAFEPPLAQELRWAVGALEQLAGLFLRDMSFLVHHQVGALHKASTAHVAHKRPLARVGALVQLHGVPPHRGVRAVRARIQQAALAQQGARHLTAA